jgi:lysophospholipase L1-like esterase
MEQMLFSWRFAKRLVYLVAATVSFGCILSAVLAGASGISDNTPAWAAPNAMAIRRVTGVTVVQSEPNFLNNLDCTPITYRQAATSTTQTGCFTEAAFGLIDTDSGNVIFNGTDEGLPLLPHTPHQILVPWPKALDVIGLDPAYDNGAQISLYKNVFVALQDQRNFLTQVTAKQLDRPPDITLKDPSGNPLVINPQTMAFSEGGAWLVVETLGGSFVRVNLATLSMTAFAPAYGSQGSPALLKSRVTITEDGRFVAIANDAATTFKVYDLATCNGVVNNLQPQNCRSYDYRPFAEQQIKGLQSIRHLRFANEGLLSFDAITSNPDNTGTYELAPAAAITSLTDYIGLGDSYTSGEGAFDYLNGSDTPNNMCHVSRNSYPLLLTHDLFNGTGGHSVACSGAVIKDVGSTASSYRGQVRDVPNFQQLQQSQPLLLESVEANFLPGYIAQQRFVQRWQPRIATVSIGGNDVGFGGLMQNCIEPHISRHVSDSTCYNTYEDRLELSHLIDRTMARWTGLYKQLQHEAPDMQLYAIGYSQLVSDTGTCALNVQLNKSELEFAESVIDYLNQDIRKAATAAGAPYVDISQALKGHRLCETASYNVAVNGLTAGTDAGIFGVKIFGKESYHPNALGHQLIEQAILKQTHNFAGAASDNAASSASDDTAPILLNAPVSGRPVNTLIPDNTLTSGVGKRGLPVSVRATGADDGLRSSTIYVVHLDGPVGSVLGTISSDGAGDLQGTVTIPADTVPGGHTIDVTGQNQSGEPVDITQPLYVPASDADSDGDGIDNITDSCPGAINSGQDSDHDGVDDICDNLIGLAAADSGGSRGLGSLGSSSENVSASSTGHTAVLGAKNSNLSPSKHRIKRPDSRPLRPAIRQFPKTIYWLPGLILLIVPGVILLAGRYIQKITFRLQ